MKKCKYSVKIFLQQNVIGRRIKESFVDGCKLLGAFENQIVKPSVLKGVICKKKCKQREEVDC